MAMPTIEMKSGLKFMFSIFSLPSPSVVSKLQEVERANVEGTLGRGPESVEGFTKQREEVDMEGGSWPEPWVGAHHCYLLLGQGLLTCLWMAPHYSQQKEEQADVIPLWQRVRAGDASAGEACLGSPPGLPPALYCQLDKGSASGDSVLVTLSSRQH